MHRHPSKLTPSQKRRVIKAGGSLLFNPNLKRHLQALTNDPTFYSNLLIVGGGSLVDQLRKWQSAWLTEQVSDEFCHEAAIRMMRETVHWVGQLCPEIPIVTTIPGIESPGSLLLDTTKFMRDQSMLPKNWSTTSDSIAAEVARHYDATELWLLKSGLPELNKIDEWQRTGFVDPMFCETARRNVASPYNAVPTRHTNAHATQISKTAYPATKPATPETAPFKIVVADASDTDLLLMTGDSTRLFGRG